MNFENKVTGLKKDIEELKALMIADKQRTVKNGSELSEKFVSALKPLKFHVERNYRAVENSKLNGQLIENCKGDAFSFLTLCTFVKGTGSFW